jgi:hypothetical protein
MLDNAETDLKNQRRRISEYIHAFFWFLYETGRLGSAWVLEVPEFLALPVQGYYSSHARGF